MELEKAIRLRKSCRGYKPDPVSKEEIQKIVDAGQLAPIAGGDYSMSHFTVVTDPALMGEIREACRLGKGDKAFDATYGAPVLILVSATGPSKDAIEYCNVACAIENMTLAATDLGLGSVYLWGFRRPLSKHPEVIEKLGLPDGYTVLSALAVGHEAEPDPSLPKPLIDVPAKQAEGPVAQPIGTNWI